MRYGELLDKPTSTVEELANKHSVPVSYIRAQLKRGIAVEHEHTKKTNLATEIALDHLGEDPDYYKKLAKVEVDENWKKAIATGALAAATAMGSSAHAAEPSNFVAKVSMQVNGQTIKKEIKLGSDYQSADDARTAVEKFLAKKGVNNYTVHIERVLDEAFDQPYAMKWEKSEADDSMDALVRLPDGSNLSIMFNMDYDEEGEEVVQAEFWRNNSQEVTGEGDAQRIFATVLAAIQQYIKKHKPKRLSFSASKEVDMDADDVEKFNPESRAKLYDRLVQRYARAWGYRAFRADNGDIVIYELSRLKQGVAEARNSLFAFVKQQFPTWPDYVLKDFLYAQAKGIRDQAELDDFLKRNKQDFGNCKWTLTKLPITFDIFTPKTQRMLASREGGSSNPFQVPRDAERHALQSQMIQQKGVSVEPIIVAKLSNGYDLIEGWHRTIQHLKAFPQGYTGPAWVCTGATYKSENVNQGVAENFADGKNPGRKGLAKRSGVNTKASVSSLRKTAKNSSGEKQRMAHWLANMKAGRAKAKRK
jgi:hypothetical protein